MDSARINQANLPKTPNSKSSTSNFNQQNENNNNNNNDNNINTSKNNSNPRTYTFSIPLSKIRPKPTSPIETFRELWNDPRPVSALISSDDRSYTGIWQVDDNGYKHQQQQQQIPYCIISDSFQIEDHDFQILLYPRGRFVGNDAASPSNSSTNQWISGPASAYLRYLPRNHGDEVDIAWKLCLCSAIANNNDTKGHELNGENVVTSSKNNGDEQESKRDNVAHCTKPLPITISGGLPKSNTTWSAAMTFCAEMEAVESVGRATDWGSSIWSAGDVCAALLGTNATNGNADENGDATDANNDNYNAGGALLAQGEITVFDTRSGESSFSFPPKGGIGAVVKAATASSSSSSFREFRVGEVIVPKDMRGMETQINYLEQQFIYPGIDYRIMTMTDGEGNEIFSTESLSDPRQKKQALLALRPCGWKLQTQLWKNYGMNTDWPVQISAGAISDVVTTRFNTDSAIPRIVSAFRRDWKTYTLALAVALTPIPASLLARNFVSFYVIPSASMEPTLLKGDVLLVEKFPRVYERTTYGDVVLFKPPPTLRDIVTSNGSQLSSTSLFVKRVVGLPGDGDIRLVDNNEVTINSKPSIGPNRELCADEPLRLIDRLLENGKGKDIDRLGEDEVYVLGDCKAVSVDSRVFGTLPKENIVGKPLARIWPLDRVKLSGDF